MPVNINQFRSIARSGGGYIRQADGDGTRLERYGRGLLGKIIYWFRAKLRPGTVLAENRQVMQSFVRALRERYGDYSNSLVRQLDLTGARPLSARTVRSLIDAGEKHRSLITGINTLTRIRFSEVSYAGQRDFGAVWYETLSAMGIRGFRMEDVAHQKLSDRIARKINLLLKRNPNRVISDPEAEAIARREVERFFTIKKTLIDHIDSMGLDEQGRTVLMELVRRGEDITSPEQLNAIWATRKEASDLLRLLKQDPPPSRREVLEALHTLSTVFYEHAMSLVRLAQERGEKFGGDDIVAMREHVIQLGMGLANIKEGDAARIFHLLSSDAVKEMQKILNSFSSDEFFFSQSETIQSTDLTFLRNVTLIEAGKRSEKSEEDIQRAIEVSSDPTHMRDIRGDVFDALKSWGFDLYRADDPLSGILQSQRGFKDFVTFSKKKQAEKYPLFWKAVEDFRSIADEEEKQAAARAIVDEFIKPGGPHEINIDDAERQAILDAVAENRLDGVFDRAQDHILALMEQNFHQDFAQWFAGQQ